MKWNNPRYVDQWYWMDIEEYEDDCLNRYGRVSWNKDGTGYFEVNINLDLYGFYCWPSFRILSEAQDFVERLMLMSLEEIRVLHGTQWPNVLL